MASESGDRKLTKQLGAPPSEPEHLPCPRCDSTNTKFCYYNNYNFSQPRHFCKACRRYWTHGGTLRDIPVGGGTRKSAKRIRSSHAATLPHPSSVVPSPALHLGDGYGAAQPCGSFTSLLGTYGPGFHGFGGFGLGVGPVFEDMGFGLRRPVWPFGDGGAVTGNTWQMQSGESGFMGGPGGGGECFTLPELAISTPGNCLK